MNLKGLALGLWLGIANNYVASTEMCETSLGYEHVRIDCGHPGTTERECISKNCCWKQATTGNYPWCFSKVSNPGYILKKSIQVSPTSLSLLLQLNGNSAQNHGIYGISIPNITVQISFDTINQLHVKILDKDQDRWEIPEDVVRSKSLHPEVKNAHDDLKYKFTHSELGESFWFAVERSSDGESLFNSSSGGVGLTYENQYLSISTGLPKGHHIYGLGERVDNLRLTPQTYTFWNYDVGSPWHNNLYGSHPVYFDVRDGGKTHAVFLRNSNGIDVDLGETSLTYKVIGGVLDLYFFVGETPAEAQESYVSLIGRPIMPPHWALGWHQCRWGYKHLSDVKYVKEQFDAHNIPLETVWNDIDYMNNKFDFTFDPVNYKADDVKAFVDEVHADDQKYVVIVDPGIPLGKDYKVWQEGYDKNVFIKNKDGDNFLGKVWPGNTNYPDFSKPQTPLWWEDQIKRFHNDVVPVDGLWIDMNEVSNFCDGECDKSISHKIFKKYGYDFNPNFPPFSINNQNDLRPLHMKTVNMDASSYIGEFQYNVHNLYGLFESMATHRALAKVNKKRPFVLTRSSFAGSGQYTFKWTGDNFSKWLYLKNSIIDLINFNLYGIPFVGADICGFNSNTNEELCRRWTMLGAFYPFSRNHNAIGMQPQEPFRWESVANVARKYIGIKNSLSWYYYTLLNSAKTTGSMVMKSLFFEFPADSNTYEIDSQFMIGRCLLVSPVVSENTDNIQVYFPRSLWYDFETKKKLDFSEKGGQKNIAVPQDSIGLHVRGGCIMPLQKPETRLTKTKLNNFDLLVTLCTKYMAKGRMYVDDGDSLEPVDNLVVDFKYEDGVLTAKPSQSGETIKSVTRLYGKVSVVGVQTYPDSITVNGQMLSKNEFTYDHTLKQVIINNLNESIYQKLEISFELNLYQGHNEGGVYGELLRVLKSILYKQD